MAYSTRRRRSSYNLLPRWFRRGRIIALVAAFAVLVVGVFAVRTVLGLGHLTGQNPLSVIGDLVGGGKGSSVSRAQVQGKRINFAFYGYGGPGHDGAYLTDSILIVSVQPRVNRPPSVAEISVPRDWFVPIPLAAAKSTQGRINSAFAAGMDGQGPLPATDPAAGAAVANPVIAHLLGITIDHWVGLDFQAFKTAVDSVGGVDINVPNTFTDTQYPAGECNGNPGQNCAYTTVHFEAGPQHMNGTTALQFSRSRHSNDNGEGTDFARSRRQQLVVAALKQKAVSVGGIGHLPDLLNSLGDNVLTDLHVNDIEALYALLKDVDTKSIQHVSFDYSNFLYDCGYPQNCGAAYIYAHDRSYRQVAHYVQNVFVDPAVLAEHAQVQVEDGSRRGLDAATRWSSLLNMLQLTTTDNGPVARHRTTQVIDHSGGRDAKTAAWLAQYFGVVVTYPATPTPAPVAGGSPVPATATPVPVNGGVELILGQDEESAFLDNPGVGT